MPRRNVERKTSSGYCKIRKRVSSSSSSSSCYSLVKNHRLKRAILVAKRPNSNTPIPSWKMASLRSPAVDKGKEAQMSARRLAATLWDFSGGVVEEDKENLRGTPTHVLGQSHSPLCKEGSKQAKHRRRSSEKLHLIEFDGEGKDSSHHGGASAKVTSHGGLDTGASNSSRLKDVSTSLTASKELVKVLLKMWSHEEQNSSRLTLVSALRVEIDRARHQVDHLLHEKRYSQKEIDALLKQLASEKAAWKSREQERILNAVSSVSRELEAERKLRRQTERLNKTLGRELADVKAQLEKAVEELGCERRAREILEKTCDELANGLGEDSAEVEAMKRECDKVREETEREKQMLQLADVLREERVQMKLADARYEYEEKNAALEMLRSELESYIGGGREEDGGEDGGEIELSMDNLSRNYKWSFANEGSAVDSRRGSVDEMFKGRRSLCEKIQWESICLQRKASDGIEWDFTVSNSNRKGNANGFDKGRLLEDRSQGELGDSKTFRVGSGDWIDGNNDGGT